MSRALLNDAKLSKHVTDNFVPYAGAIEQLQPSRYGQSKTISSDWFEPMAKKAMVRFGAEAFWKQFKSYQGFYVVGADAHTYGYKVVWKLSPADVIGWLDQTRARFKDAPPGKVTISDETIEKGELPQVDPTTSVIRVYSRVRPVPDGCDKLNHGIGRDHLWIYAKEVRAMLDAAKEQDKDVPLPRKLSARLVRFTLLDSVRNVGGAFGATDVSKAAFILTRLGETDGLRRFRLRGEYASERVDVKNGWKGKTGISGKLDGALVIDVAKSMIVKARLHGKATAWGHRDTQAPEGRYPLLFALVESTGRFARSIPPIYHSISPVWTPKYNDPWLAIWKERKDEEK